MASKSRKDYGNTYDSRSGPSLVATPQWVAKQIATLPLETRQHLLEEISLRKLAAEFVGRGYSRTLVSTAVRACR